MIVLLELVFASIITLELIVNILLVLIIAVDTELVTKAHANVNLIGLDPRIAHVLLL